MTRGASKSQLNAAPPPLSVVMPVHNTLPYLDQAVESILGQQFSDFEFVILDDASTDGSRERLHQWEARDARIRLIEVERNLGPVDSSNMVARAAKAPLVARMDADDISDPDRLSAEFELLQRHPEIGLVASLCNIIDGSGNKVRDTEVWRLSQPSVFVPFPHGSIMYRREVFDRVGGYRKPCQFWEDQDLIVRIAEVAEVAVIPRPLYRVRQSTTSTRVVSSQDELERAVDKVYRATDLLEMGKSYDDVLDRRQNDAKLDPRVFIAVGSVRLWAGGRPRLLRRTLARARLSWDTRSAAALIWAAWASASPSTLRSFMLFLLRTRNRRAKGRISTLKPLRWKPRERAEPIEELEARS